MKRYLAFCGRTHYPSGGFKDFFLSYDTVKDASKSLLDYCLREHVNWYQIVDSNNSKIVEDKQVEW